MSIEPSVLVLSAAGWPVAAIEVKNRPALGASDAKTYRRNLFAHAILTKPIDYVLVVSQDVGYLWGPSKKDDLDADPDVRFDMTPILARYGVAPGSPRRLYGEQVELFTSSWIRELVNREGPATSEPERTLERVGFAAAVRRGTVLVEAAA